MGLPASDMCQQRRLQDLAACTLNHGIGIKTKSIIACHMAFIHPIQSPMSTDYWQNPPVTHGLSFTERDPQTLLCTAPCQIHAPAI